VCRRYASRAPAAADLAIPLAFDGAGPLAFGAAPAKSDPLTMPGFSGRVAGGASCNASVLTVTPHGNGTHTESIAHVADGGPPVPGLIVGGWMPARLASVEAATGAIGAEALAGALADARADGCAAFVLRTRPNDARKLSRTYGDGEQPAWLAAGAAQAIADAGIEHLLVDLPSLDRLDDPALPAHRAFFGLAGDAPKAARRRATVTEFVYAPEELPDGLYLVEIQAPRWQLEAVPSRPLALPAEEITEKEPNR